MTPLLPAWGEGVGGVVLGVLDVDDGQRHPVEGDRSLDGDVAGDLPRQADAQEVPVLAVVAAEDLGGGIDVTLNDVPAEPVGGAQGALEVDRVSGRWEPRVVRVRVSAMRSAVKVLPCMAATVRQHPLTLMESPRLASWVTVGASTVSRAQSSLVSSRTTRPSSSTIPVNISDSSRCGGG